MSMANSLEVRVPFLDHKIVELAFSLPLNLRVRAVKGGSIAKYLLKKLAGQFLPQDLIHRPKMGFGIPVDEWCRRDLRELIEDGLRDRHGEIFHFLDFKAVAKLLDLYYRNGPVSPAQIWCLLMLDLWFREVHGMRQQKPLALSA
jgi:asparagine synthase (glutamine-hydrolysing)